MKKLFLLCAIITMCTLFPTQDVEHQNELIIPNEQDPTQKIIQTLSNFFDIAAEKEIELDQKLIELQEAIYQCNEIERDAVRKAVEYALEALEPLQQDEQIAPVYHQLQQDNITLLTEQHRSAFAGIQVFDKLTVYNQVATYGPVSINYKTGINKPALSVNGGAMIDDLSVGTANIQNGTISGNITANTITANAITTNSLTANNATITGTLTTNNEIITGTLTGNNATFNTLSAVTIFDTGASGNVGAVFTVGAGGRLSPAMFAPGGVSSVNSGTGINVNGPANSPVVNLIVPVAIANGGTNATSMPNVNGTVFYNGILLTTTAPGSAGQVLTSNGSGSAPTYQSISSASPSVATNFTTNSGTARPSANNLNIFGSPLQGISTSGSDSTVTITAANATTTTKGVASFSPTNFTITNGAVSSNNFTITAGTGLTGGGSLTLGGSTTIALSTPVSIANGGTNTTSMPNTNGTVFYNGTQLTTTAPGSAGQVLTSNGAASSPTYQSISSASPSIPTNFVTNSGTARPIANTLNILGSASQGISTSGSGSTVTITAANATSTTKGVASFSPTNFTVTNGAVSSNNFTITAGTGLTGGGSLTLGGSTTIALSTPVSIANGGTNTTSMPNANGTVYFNGTLLTTTAPGSAGQVLTSNGSGSAPTYQSISSASPSVATNFTTNSGTARPSANNLNIFGSPLQGISTSGSGSTVTITAANATTTTKGVASFSPTNFTITNGAVSSNNFTITAGTGLTGGGSLTLGGSTTLSLSTPVTVANGGTAATSFTAFAPVIGGTTSTSPLQSAATGMSNVGFVLTSTGSSSAPTWQSPGGVSSGLQTINTNNGSATQSGGSMTFTGLPAGKTVTFSGSASTVSLNSTDGIGNTTIGANAGSGLTSGSSNTALGSGALQSTSSGANNVAIGVNALQNNTTGGGNIAIGFDALQNNNGVNTNIAIGFEALMANTIGTGNIGIGSGALQHNTTGSNNTAIGMNTLENNVTSSGSTAVGSSALLNNNSSPNTAVGANALTANTTGNQNTAVGYNALSTNTIGFENTAVGYNALFTNTTGMQNTAVGANALAANGSILNTAVGANALAVSNAVHCTAVGALALTANTTGTENTALGTAALQNNTIGINNVAVGYQALNSNAIGSSNVAVGYLALENNITSANTAVGTLSLQSNTTGINNTALGYNTLNANTGGQSLVAVGSQALSKNSTGNDNIAVGKQALQNTTTGINNIGVGSLTLGANITGSNNVAIGFEALQANTGGFQNIAIGTSALIANTTGQDNIAIGFDAMQFFNGGANLNIAIGFSALQGESADIMTGSNNIAIGELAIANIVAGSNNVAVGPHNGAFPVGSGLTSGSNNIYITSAYGGSNESNTIRIGTQGIGTAQQNACFIAGIRGITTSQANAINVLIDSNGQLGTASSSQRYKENIKPIASISSNLMAMNPVEFTYKSDVTHTKQYGLIAEDVEQLDPALVMYNDNGSPETVYYQFLPPMLLKGWQEQQNEIALLKAQNENQQHAINETKQIIAEQQQRIDELFARYVTA